MAKIQSYKRRRIDEEGLWIEVTGAVGIARTLIYKGIVGEPIYHLSENGEVSDGTDDMQSFFVPEIFKK